MHKAPIAGVVSTWDRTTEFCNLPRAHHRRLILLAEPPVVGLRFGGLCGQDVEGLRRSFDALAPSDFLGRESQHNYGW